MFSVQMFGMDTSYIYVDQEAVPLYKIAIVNELQSVFHQILYA